MRIARPALAALLILLVLAGLWRRDRPEALDRYDQRFYLGIAFDLRHHHRFTDGFLFAGGDAGTERPPGMRFAPLYPAVLAGAALLDPAFAAATDCLVAHRGDAATCSRAGGNVRQLQFVLLAAVFWMIWWSAAALAGSARTGWVALAIALLTAPLLLLSVDYLMTETVSLFLSTAAQTAALRASLSRRHRDGFSLLAGLALGLAVLSRPGFMLLAAAAIAVSGLAMLLRRLPARPVLLGWCGIALAVGPWVGRNLVVLHRASLTFGYASHTFVQRLSFDSMGWGAWGLSFACWLPDGNGLGALFGGPHACDRFGWDDHPDSFYAIGIGPMLAATLRASGGLEHHMAYLVHTYLLAQPLSQIGWHLMVTLPLALRGMYVDHWWGLVLSVPCLALTWRALRRPGPQACRLLLLSLPAWFMLGVNAAIAVNQTRYNLALVVPFSIAAALALRRAPWPPGGDAGGPALSPPSPGCAPAA